MFRSVSILKPLDTSAKNHSFREWCLYLTKILRFLKIFYDWCIYIYRIHPGRDVTDSDSWRQYSPRADPLLRAVNVEMKVSGIQLSRRNLKSSRHRPRSLIHISRVDSRRTEGTGDNYIKTRHNFTTNDIIVNVTSFRHSCPQSIIYI